MAYDSLKALIRQYIKTNGEQEITGQIMQNVLIEMVNQYPSTDGFATQSWVTSQGYITASALSGYATQSWVNTQLGGYLPLTGGNLNGNLSIYDTMNIYSSSIEWNDSGDYCRIAFDQDGITVTAHGTGYVTANEFIKSGGTSAQFLKADGSVDSNTYLTSAALSGYATQSWVTTQLGGYLPLTGGNLNGNLSIYDTMNIYSSSIEWNDSGDYCRIAFDQDGITVTAHGTGYVTANEFIKSGGTSAQFLKADGSVDSNTYLTSASLAGYATQSWVQQQGYLTSSALSGYATQSWVTTQLGSYLPLTGGNLNGNLSIYDTMNIYSSSIEWNDSGDYCRIAFDQDGITVTSHGTGYVTANEFIKSGGTSSQFLKADGSVDSTAYLPKQGSSFYFITDADMPETAANISTLNAAHRMTLYRNAILMPYQMNDANDGGFIRSRGTSENSAIFEIGMWDDSGAGETIQFNYYPTTSTINPTYSVTVPKKSGTIALTSDLASYNPTTNFKTINNQSIIGTGNINIEGGGTLYDAEIEYLESTGTQCIDTGVYVTQYPLQVESKAYFISGSNNEQDIFGNFKTDATKCIVAGKNGSSFYVWTGIAWNPAPLSNNTWYIVKCEALSTSSLKLTINGTEYTKTQTNSITSSDNSSIYLFCTGSAKTSYLTGRIGYVKIYINNVLVRDFIPVRVGNVGYLYDKVSGELFGNSGTGSFVLGQDTGPGGGLPYLPLTGGTITGNLTINSGSDGTSLYIYGKDSNGYGRIYVDGDGLNFDCSRGVLYFQKNSYFSGNIDVDARMGVGTDHSSTYQLIVNGQVGATGFVNTSDLRKKTIMGDVPMNLYNVANAPLFKFTWNDEKEYSGQHIGSAAQYWQTILPELVIQGSDADMTLAMQYDVIALASAITVAKTVVNHEERIILLERENEALKKEIADLKSA